MQVLITDAGRERLARWLFAQMSNLATVGGLGWEHLGDSVKHVWLDHADQVIGLLRENPNSAHPTLAGEPVRPL